MFDSAARMSSLQDKLFNNRGKKGGELPLYKDKPNFSPKPTSRKKKVFNWALRAFIVVFLYFLYTHRPVRVGKWASAQQEVREAFLTSWHTYEKLAWGKDEFHPVSGKGNNMGNEPLGWMIVDSLDALMIMDAEEEVSRARGWIKKELSYTFDYNASIFETTIRMLGGLLSAFHFSKDDLYLDKAADLANVLVEGFKTPTEIPYSSVNLQNGQAVKNSAKNGASSTAEVGTLQLEFKYLAFLTGETMYWERVEKITEVMDKNRPVDGLVPTHIDPDTGKYHGTHITLGSKADSYYEYLLKQFLQTSGQEPVYWEMYKESLEGVKKHLVAKSGASQLTFVGELEKGIGGPLSTNMDHLACFYGGLVALGATGGKTLQEAKKQADWSDKRQQDFDLGAELTYTCYKMYHDTPSGLAPDKVQFNTEATQKSDFYVQALDRYNVLRPETVESLFYLYRLTGDEKWREYGYEIFQSFLKYAKVVNDDGDIAFTSLDDVTKVPPPQRDFVESFWYAETLKYLYLLFDDTNKIPLDQYVFNTEAHPFPIFELGPTFKTGFRRERSGQKINKEPVKVDKKKIPEAAPVNKPVEQEAQEEIKKNPKVAEDNEQELKAKMDKLLKDLDKT